VGNALIAAPMREFPLISHSGLIDHLPVLVGRIGDTADDVLALLEPLGGDDDHIEGVAEAAKRVVNTDALFAAVAGVTFHHEYFYVAVAGHVARGGRAEDYDAIRLGHTQYPPDDLLHQRLVNSHGHTPWGFVTIYLGTSPATWLLNKRGY